MLQLHLRSPISKAVLRIKHATIARFLKHIVQKLWCFPGGSGGKESACSAKDPHLIPGLGRSLGWEDLLEKGIATHCSILAWRIPGTEQPGGL